MFERLRRAYARNGLSCVDRSERYSQALLLAANLAEDEDTGAAVTGQIAGALWRCGAIPNRWLDRLAWRAEFEERARRLLALPRRVNEPRWVAKAW